MGTRAIVRVMGSNQEILCLYRQFDGYPEGLGQEIADFAKPFTIGNGIPLNAEPGTFANGMGCFAAQLLKHLKEDVGNVYVQAPGTSDRGEEFTYIVSQSGESINIQVSEGPVTFFGASSEEGTHNFLWSGHCAEYDPAKMESAYH